MLDALVHVTLVALPPKRELKRAFKLFASAFPRAVSLLVAPAADGCVCERVCVSVPMLPTIESNLI